MQYLVSEIKAGASPSGESKVFDAVSDAVKYIQKTDEVKVLLIDGKDKSIDQIAWLLTEKLSTVTINSPDRGKKWIITAF